MVSELEIEARVTLLAILKKKPEETLDDVRNMLMETGMYDLEGGKRVFGELEKAHYIVEGGLSMTGAVAAQKAEEEFRQP